MASSRFINSPFATLFLFLGHRSPPWDHREAALLGVGAAETAPAVAAPVAGGFRAPPVPAGLPTAAGAPPSAAGVAGSPDAFAA